MILEVTLLVIDMNLIKIRYGNGVGWGGVGWGGAKGWVVALASHSFVLPHTRSALHDGGNFLTPSPPFGALRSPALSRKTLLFINFPTASKNFLVKLFSLIKIYLKL